MIYQEIPSKISGIYKINFPNGKIYIGRAKNIKYRIWEHFSKKDNTPCQKALWYYYKSYEQINVEILEEVSPYDYEIICSLEKKWIKQYNAKNKEIGYNLTDGGDGGATGIDNPASKFTSDDLNNIIDLLRQGKTNIYIANIYGVHPDTIGKINNGKHYVRDDIDYPIRKGKREIPYKDKYNSFTNEQLDTAIFLLSTSNLTNEQIGKKLSMSISTIIKLNLGKHPHCKDLNIVFPIRKTRKTIKFTEEEIKLIKAELLVKDYSIQDIANHFGCSRDTISDINQGKRYSNPNEKYPIRNFYPNRGSKKSVSTISGSGE